MNLECFKLPRPTLPNLRSLWMLIAALGFAIMGALENDTGAQDQTESDT